MRLSDEQIAGIQMAIASGGGIAKESLESLCNEALERGKELAETQAHLLATAKGGAEWMMKGVDAEERLAIVEERLAIVTQQRDDANDRLDAMAKRAELLRTEVVRLHGVVDHLRQRGDRAFAKAEAAERRVAELREALQTLRRAYDPQGGCLPSCASETIEGEDCDCGYVEAGHYTLDFIDDALAAQGGRE